MHHQPSFDSSVHQSNENQLHQFFPPLDNQINSLDNMFEREQFDHLLKKQQTNMDEALNSQNTILPQLTKKISTPTKKRVRKYTSNNPNNKKGHWTHGQNIKYHWFLELNASKFIESQRRKVQKTFKSMSAFIQTRQAHQCRSHHQKMQVKYKGFSNILLNLRNSHYGSPKAEILRANMEKAGYQCQTLIQSDLLQNEQKLYLVYCKKNEKQVSSQNFDQKGQKQGQYNWDNDSSLFSEDQKGSSENKLLLSDQYEDYFQRDIQ